MGDTMTPTDHFLVQAVSVFLKSRQIEIEYLEILVELVPIKVRRRFYGLAIEVGEVAGQLIL